MKKNPLHSMVALGAIACLVVLSVTNTGCATLINGTTQMIPVSSSPSGALVTVNGQTRRTPCTLKLRRGRAYMVAVSMPGFVTQTRHLVRVPTDATIGNVLVGGLIGMGIDVLSGAKYKLVPESLHVSLPRLDDQGRTTDRGTRDGPEWRIASR